MNWNKILANFLLVFFGTLSTAYGLGLGVEGFKIAIVNAFLLGAVAASKEYYEECGEGKKLSGLALIA